VVNSDFDFIRPIWKNTQLLVLLHPEDCCRNSSPYKQARYDKSATAPEQDRGDKKCKKEDQGQDAGID